MGALLYAIIQLYCCNDTDVILQSRNISGLIRFLFQNTIHLSTYPLLIRMYLIYNFMVYEVRSYN